MLRLSAAALALLSLFGLVPSVALAAGCEIEEEFLFKGAVICSGSGATDVPGAQGSSGRPGRQVDPAHLSPEYVLRAGPTGPCIATVMRDLGRVPTEGDRLDQERMVGIYLHTYEFCPGSEPVVSPAVLAEEVVRRVALPVPVPRIAPGWMLVGLEAFLETGAPVQRSYAESTVLGPIEVVASAVTEVDWGDGSTGVYEGSGGPFPDGSVRHVFTDAGTYDVVVSYRWVARWRIGDATGVIDSGLVTSATLADFEVQQRQAVVTCTGADCD